MANEISSIERRGAMSETLEKMIDSDGLRAVLFALTEVCDNKAGHIRENWQDEPLANVWTLAAMRVDSAAHTLAIRRLSEIEGR